MLCQAFWVKSVQRCSHCSWSEPELPLREVPARTVPRSGCETPGHTLRASKPLLIELAAWLRSLKQCEARSCSGPMAADTLDSTPRPSNFLQCSHASHVSVTAPFRIGSTARVRFPGRPLRSCHESNESSPVVTFVDLTSVQDGRRYEGQWARSLVGCLTLAFLDMCRQDFWLASN